MACSTYLITGAARGIGLGLVSRIAERSDTIVIAAVRHAEHHIAGHLSDLQCGHKLMIQIDSLVESDPKKAVETIRNIHGIDHIDVLIANAGVGVYYGPASETPAEEYRRHFEINALAPMMLFQAFWPMLQKSQKPKFIAVSSRLASIEGLEFWADLPGNALSTYLPAAPYGGSKAMLNYYPRRLHFEHKELIAFPLSPGWVQTEQGDIGAIQRGLARAPVSIEVSVDGMLDKIDKATKETTSGKFISFDSTNYAW